MMDSLCYNMEANVESYNYHQRKVFNLSVMILGHILDTVKIMLCTNFGVNILTRSMFLWRYTVFKDIPEPGARGSLYALKGDAIVLCCY